MSFGKQQDLLILKRTSQLIGTSIKYKGEIKGVKKDSWVNFCKTIDVINGAARFRNVLSKDPKPIESIKKKYSICTDSSLNSRSELIFPAVNIQKQVTIGAIPSHSDQRVMAIKCSSGTFQPQKVAWSRWCYTSDVTEFIMYMVSLKRLKKLICITHIYLVYQERIL